MTAKRKRPITKHVIVPQERRRTGMWTTWAGHGITILITIVGMTFSYGRLVESQNAQAERLRALEAQQVKNREDLAQDRREMKTDIQRELQGLQATISQLDSKVTTLLMDRAGSRGRAE